jgi:serine/threonine protein kinase
MSGPDEADPGETKLRETRLRETQLRPPSPVGTEVSYTTLKPAAPDRTAVSGTYSTVWSDRDAASRRVPLSEGYQLRNRYTLIQPIGQGAMGEVWKARDSFSEKAHDRNPFVAIKVFRGDFEHHPLAYTAMQREASRAMQLAHPNIVTVHHFDQDERSGRTFIVMELLEGQPLDKLIRDRLDGLPPQEAWPIIKGMSEGLAYAHRKGLVHSDFKPGNAFLTRDGIAKVLDFGIARAARQADAGAEGDPDSVVSGYTLSYAAPQALQQQPADTSDDVFALGLVAYELLSGSHPFKNLPANQAQSQNLRPAFIRGLKRREWRAIDKALAFRREDRFADAAAFLRSLQGWTLLQRSLAAAVLALSILAVALAYRSYVDSLPDVAFSDLPPAEQQIVAAALADGRSALRLAEQEHIMEASDDAANAFAKAYEHHPKDPDAVAGLKRSADLFIRWCESLPDRKDALAKLREFQKRSDYYQSYGPLKSAIEKLE